MDFLDRVAEANTQVSALTADGFLSSLLSSALHSCHCQATPFLHFAPYLLKPQCQVDDKILVHSEVNLPSTLAGTYCFNVLYIC